MRSRFVLILVVVSLNHSCDDALCPTGTHEVGDHCLQDQSVTRDQANPSMTAVDTTPRQDAGTAGAISSPDGAAGSGGQSAVAGMLSAGNESASDQGGSSTGGTSAGSGTSGIVGSMGGAAGSQTSAGSNSRQSAGNGVSAGMSGAAGSTGGGSGASAGASGAQPSQPPCVATDEICDNKDNDCDSKVDENIPLRPCGVSRPPCAQGTVSCVAGSWTTQCVGEIGPTAEQCDGIDNDCNGYVDEICECRLNEEMRCGNANPPCREGRRKCVDGFWSATCEGEVKGTPEVCDGIDNDCSGEADDAGGICTFDCAGTLGCVVCLTSDECAVGYECRNHDCLMVR
jgi:hypothetical protein